MRGNQELRVTVVVAFEAVLSLAFGACRAVDATHTREHFCFHVLRLLKIQNTQVETLV